MYIKDQKAIKEKYAEGPDREAALEKLGPLPVHLYNTMVGQTILEPPSVEEGKALEEFMKGVKTIADYGNEIRVVRLSPMYDSKLKRLEVSIVPEISGPSEGPPKMSAAMTWPIVRRALLKEKGCKAMRGQAPPGKPERELQKMLYGEGS